MRELLNSSGEPLPGATRAFFESRFRHDFSKVRVHSGARAAASAGELRARAYTVGRDIVLGARSCAPGSASATWLLAHELAHVAQTEPGSTVWSRVAVESDATRAASAAVANRPVRIMERHAGTALFRFGEPENVPQFTYIGRQNRPQDGFLQDARTYHTNWGLAPIIIDSLESVVDHLAGATSALDRIRIVSHANTDNLFVGLFHGDAPGVDLPRLTAFSQGAVQGLTEILGDFASPQFIDVVLSSVRASNPAVLQPFGLQSPGAAPAGVVATFLRRATELLMMRRGTSGSAAQRAVIAASLNTILADLRLRLTQPAPAGAGVTAVQVRALESAILGLTSLTISFSLDTGQVARLQTANTAIAGNFQNRLNQARTRFTSTTWIDVRGCRIAGGGLDYLHGIADFFGRPGQLPHVSGPEWFQSFPQLGWRTLLDNEITGFAVNADVRAALDHWSPLVGVRQWMSILRDFYQNILILRRLGLRLPLAAMLVPQLNLLGGLLTPDLDTLLSAALMVPLRLILQGLGRDIAVPGTTPRQPLNLGMPALRDPTVQFAEDGLRDLDRPDAELRYYLRSALVLPVQSATRVTDVRLFMLNSLRSGAVDNWLAAQWASSAPGLDAMQRRRWNDGATRQVAALVKERPNEADANQESVFSPDPRYQDHIKKT